MKEIIAYLISDIDFLYKYAIIKNIGNGTYIPRRGGHHVQKNKTSPHLNDEWWNALEASLDLDDDNEDPCGIPFMSLNYSKFWVISTLQDDHIVRSTKELTSLFRGQDNLRLHPIINVHDTFYRTIGNMEVDITWIDWKKKHVHFNVYAINMIEASLSERQRAFGAIRTRKGNNFLVIDMLDVFLSCDFGDMDEQDWEKFS